MRTKRRSNKQLQKTSKNRESVYEFMKRFHGRCYWVVNGPINTDVDEMFCFAIFDKDGESMGIVLVQTWCSGGWEVYVPPSQNGDLDVTEAAIRLIATRPIAKRDDAEINTYVVTAPSLKLSKRSAALLRVYTGLKADQIVVVEEPKYLHFSGGKPANLETAEACRDGLQPPPEEPPQPVDDGSTDPLYGKRMDSADCGEESADED